MTKLQADMLATRQLMDKALDEKLPVIDVPYAPIIDAMRYSTLAGGKAIRPFLTLTIAQFVGLSQKVALDIACAIEMVHTYSLIHDDLPAMDNDVLRRGKPTCHVAFDEATAILAGDALLTLPFQLLSSDDFDCAPEIKCQLMNQLSLAIGHHGMIAGQVLDLMGEKNILSEAQIYQMNRLKTGCLIEFSCLAPAIAVGADKDTIDALQTYASSIGLLFQITDDILDETGTSAQLGKTPGKDKTAQKSTFVTIFGLEKAKEMAIAFHQQAIDAVQNETLTQLADFILLRDK